ncbi:MAG: guanylate kinase [Chlorobium limicola]|jgi:guanylate kinase|uniref:Guanylate kinase n=1 Tax=Chlorobium limicola (strain DSM 245 / NBRC 103803 / 6330) TaxID=290315 RepID=B3EFB7_CHLL2|nr:guanylate kinase [Chlorobium limicola]ACD89400.1 Guanylate kinase [Chlorobium limicola DSM 245]NTV07137.1 guanylate kinase [Chlorobium limicola]NTV20195.1 guanylate kinase [Chlorobium limicola]
MEQGAPKGKLIVFSAPSGTGKSTIAKAVLGQIGELSFSVSATTRSKRPGEEEGVHYFFLDKKEFEERIEKGDFIEYEYFFGNYYGTLLDKTREAIDSGRHLLLDLDVKGALNLKKLFPLDSLLLFIRPPSMAVLQERLLQRDGNSPGLQERLERAALELGYAEQFDDVVVNDDLEQTVTAVTGKIRKYLTTL